MRNSECGIRNEIQKAKECGMRPEPCKVQGCPALHVVQGGLRNKESAIERTEKEIKVGVKERTEV